MLGFAYQTRTSPVTELQTSGTFRHSTQEVVVAYSLSSQTPGVVATFLHHFQEVFDRHLFQTTLEFHQFFEQILQTAQRMQVQCSFAGVAYFEEHIAIASYRGGVVLKREQKVGQILAVEERLLLIEGKIHAGDSYLLLTDAATELYQALQPELSKMSSVATQNFFEKEACPVFLRYNSF